MTCRNALEYVGLPPRSPDKIIADCRRMAETCRTIAKKAAAACNAPVAAYYEQRALELEQQAVHVAQATGAAL